MARENRMDADAMRRRADADAWRANVADVAARVSPIGRAQHRRHPVTGAILVWDSVTKVWR